jgi:hypothetical protein
VLKGNAGRMRGEGGAKAFAMPANESDSAPEICEECRLPTWISAHWRR